MKILIIDDDEIVLASLGRLLQGYFEVVTTATPEVALLLAMNEHPDAVLCDIDMPGLSGGDLSCIFRENPATTGLPFFYLTSYVSPAEVCALDGVVGGRPGIAKATPVLEIVRRLHAVMKH